MNAVNTEHRSSEAVNALAMAGVSIGFDAGVEEQAGAKGIYHAVFEGYKESHKAEYLYLFPKLLEMRRKRDQLLRYTPSLARGLINNFLKELEDFEQFMKNMTEVKRDVFAPNVVCDLGANALLDNGPLAASGYTAVGPYMGLISSIGYSAIVAANTMASHAGWTEAGITNAPTYTGPRKTIAWSAASARSKAPSAAPVFTFTGAGTVKGVFMCFHTGAVSTIDSTAGTLYSAGLFSGGDQVVANTNTVTVTYSTSV